MHGNRLRSNVFVGENGSASRAECLQIKGVFYETAATGEGRFRLTVLSGVHKRCTEELFGHPLDRFELDTLLVLPPVVLQYQNGSNCRRRYDRFELLKKSLKRFAFSISAI